MLTVYIGKLLPRYQYLEILYPNLGALVPANIFGEKHPFADASPVLQTVEYPREADAFLLPYNWNLIAAREPEYVEQFVRLAGENGKPLIVSAQGDAEDRVSVPAAVILRSGAYRASLRSEEVVTPPAIPDVGLLHGVSLREKVEKPTVGFCGYGAPGGGITSLKFALKDTLAGVRGVFSSAAAVRRQGIHFRKVAMQRLSASPRVATDFIVRSYHSASRKTIGMEPTLARKEYIDNMKRGDFVLAPKGNGNFSLRFFEALALARTPILVDTDVVLPAEDRITYDDFIVRVSYRDIGNVANVVADWYAKLSPEAFAQKEQLARSAFEEQLYVPRFYLNLFNELEVKAKAGRLKIVEKQFY